MLPGVTIFRSVLRQDVVERARNAVPRLMSADGAELSSGNDGVVFVRDDGAQSVDNLADLSRSRLLATSVRRELGADSLHFLGDRVVVLKPDTVQEKYCPVDTMTGRFRGDNWGLVIAPLLVKSITVALRVLRSSVQNAGNFAVVGNDQTESEVFRLGPGDVVFARPDTLMRYSPGEETHLLSWWTGRYGGPDTIDLHAGGQVGAVGHERVSHSAHSR